MSDKSKKNAITLLDVATTRKAVVYVARMVHAKMDIKNWPEVWDYAKMRFNRLPDDGTALVNPRWGMLKSGSKRSASQWRKGTPGERAGLATMSAGFAKRLMRFANPIIVGAKTPAGEIPDEFRDWNVDGKAVDLHLEFLQGRDGWDTASMNKTMNDFNIGEILAMFKGGRWFLIGVIYGSDLGHHVLLTVEPTTEDEAMKYTVLPRDWESVVETHDRGPTSGRPARRE